VEGATPEKTSLHQQSVCEQNGGFSGHKSSPSTTPCRPVLSSASKLSESKRSSQSPASKQLLSSAAKRLQYTFSPCSEKIAGDTEHDLKTSPSRTAGQKQDLTTATQRSLPRNASHCVNGADSSRNASPRRTPKVGQMSPFVGTRSASPKVRPKVAVRSADFAVRSPEVSRSPRAKYSPSVSAVKHGRLVSPAGQPKTKKFIVERLRRAKTSHKRPADVTKSSPVRKAEQQTGKSMSVLRFLSGA